MTDRVKGIRAYQQEQERTLKRALGVETYKLLEKLVIQKPAYKPKTAIKSREG